MSNTDGAYYRALFLHEKLGDFQIGPRRLPKPAPGEVIIKEISVALNPVDWKTKEFGILEREYPAILGCEGAGEVESVGEGVAKFNKGDQVFHQAFWHNDYSTFQEYVLCPAELVFRLPSNITHDQAASIPVGLGTASVPFYSQAPFGFGFKAPWDGGRNLFAGQAILVFGGATSVGQYAIQLARLSGFSAIIATASLHNTELLKSLGATHVVDRNTPAASFASTIKRLIPIPLTFVHDAIASEETQQLGYDVLQDGGYLATVHPPSVKETTSGKKVLHIVGSLYLPENRQLGEALAKHVPGLIESGEIIPNKIEVVPGGLHGVIPGLERMKNNPVSGKKLIIHPRETVTRGAPRPRSLTMITSDP